MSCKCNGRGWVFKDVLMGLTEKCSCVQMAEKQKEAEDGVVGATTLRELFGFKSLPKAPVWPPANKPPVRSGWNPVQQVWVLEDGSTLMAEQWENNVYGKIIIGE